VGLSDFIELLAALNQGFIELLAALNQGKKKLKKESVSNG
jgi:hypothetical protein